MRIMLFTLLASLGLLAACDDTTDQESTDTTSSEEESSTSQEGDSSGPEPSPGDMELSGEFEVVHRWESENFSGDTAENGDVVPHGAGDYELFEPGVYRIVLEGDEAGMYFLPFRAIPDGADDDWEQESFIADIGFLRPNWHKADDRPKLYFVVTENAETPDFSADDPNMIQAATLVQPWTFFDDHPDPWNEYHETQEKNINPWGPAGVVHPSASWGGDRENSHALDDVAFDVEMTIEKSAADQESELDGTWNIYHYVEATDEDVLIEQVDLYVHDGMVFMRQTIGPVGQESNSHPHVMYSRGATFDGDYLHAWQGIEDSVEFDLNGMTSGDWSMKPATGSNG